jgi:hypothetical protein
MFFLALLAKLASLAHRIELNMQDAAFSLRYPFSPGRALSKV